LIPRFFIVRVSLQMYYSNLTRFFGSHLDRFIYQGLGRTEVRADGITLAQVTLDIFVVLCVVQGASERARSLASAALDADILMQFYCSGIRISAECIDEA